MENEESLLRLYVRKLARLSLSYLMRIVGVDYPGQPEVSNLEQQLVCVDEYVGRLQISVQDVG